MKLVMDMGINVPVPCTKKERMQILYRQQVSGTESLYQGIGYFMRMEFWDIINHHNVVKGIMNVGTKQNCQDIYDYMMELMTAHIERESQNSVENINNVIFNRNMVKENFENHPEQYVKRLKECLIKEEELLGKYFGVSEIGESAFIQVDSCGQVEDMDQKLPSENDIPVSPSICQDCSFLVHIEREYVTFSRLSEWRSRCSSFEEAYVDSGNKVLDLLESGMERLSEIKCIFLRYQAQMEVGLMQKHDAITEEISMIFDRFSWVLKKFHSMFNNTMLPRRLEGIITAYPKLSLPFNLYTGYSQMMPNAGTRLWYFYCNKDDMFGNCRMRESLQKDEFLEMLGMVISAISHRSLLVSEKEFLWEQIPRKANNSKQNQTIEEDQSTQIGEEQFTTTNIGKTHEKAESRDFTFYTWFIALVNTLKTYLLKPWADGLIFGILTTEKAERILQNTDVPLGTALLRPVTSRIKKKSENKETAKSFVKIAVHYKTLCDTESGTVEACPASTIKATHVFKHGLYNAVFTNTLSHVHRILTSRGKMISMTEVKERYPVNEEVSGYEKITLQACNPPIDRYEAHSSSAEGGDICEDSSTLWITDIQNDPSFGRITDATSQCQSSRSNSISPQPYTHGKVDSSSDESNGQQELSTANATSHQWVDITAVEELLCRQTLTPNIPNEYHTTFSDQNFNAVGVQQNIPNMNLLVPACDNQDGENQSHNDPTIGGASGIVDLMPSTSGVSEHVILGTDQTMIPIEEELLILNSDYLIDSFNENLFENVDE